MSTIINDIFSELDRWDRWRLAVTDFKLDDTSFRIAAPNITIKYYKFFKKLIGILMAFLDVDNVACQTGTLELVKYNCK